MLKVVIDTNVFISGILTEGGNPSLVIKIWKMSHKYQLFITEDIIQEILRVLKRLNVIVDIITDWNEALRKNAIFVKSVRKIEIIKEDPHDNKFLECAVEAAADYIISGDRHLYEISEFEGIKIVNAKEFLNILARSS